MLKTVLGHNRHLRMLKCAGCLREYEIPKACEIDPEKFAVLRETLEQQHLGQGCMQAAEVREYEREKRAAKVLEFKPRPEKRLNYREVAMQQAIRVLGNDNVAAGQFGPN